MEQNYQSTKLPTVGASSAIGGASAWSNPSRITADDASSASWAAFGGGQSSAITGSVFGFPQLPDGAIIDGIQVFVDGSNFNAGGDVALNIAGSTSKLAGALSGSFGGSTDLWGKTEITRAQVAALAVTITQYDISGGDASASIDYLSVTVFWHIELEIIPTDVPTRVDHKVYSRSGRYLGLLPDVSSKFAFPQDINSAGSSIEITCGKYIKNDVTISPLLTEAGDPITTEDDRVITVAQTDLVVAQGDSVDDAMFKNGNRIKSWLYNQYYPNGKLVFSGQVNRVKFRYGAGETGVKLTVYSDGLDLDQYIARGYPFVYTLDVNYPNWTTSLGINFDGGKGAGWYTLGQTFTTGPAVTNLGAIILLLQGTADVLISIYDAPNGDLIGSTTKSIANGSPAEVQFEFASLLPVTPNTQYFLAIWLSPGQTINAYLNYPGALAGGDVYESTYSGGSGGGSFILGPSDLYLKTFSGTPTTTTTYASKDPVADMAHGILLDYNARGGYITERDFDPTGLSLTYTFVVATIFDALKKVLEMSQTGYYWYIDLGTADIDIQQMSDTADFTIVRGRDFSQLDIDLSIEQVKNYLLLSGGETAGTNLYRDYQDNESATNYGIRTATKSDNRITIAATADAIGDSFIAENADEKQETSLIVLNSMIDITLLIPGKTIGFKNFDSFIDTLVLPIVRREPNFSDGYTKLTLGRLPVRMTDEIQRIQRELVFEQTIKNPSTPS